MFIMLMIMIIVISFFVRCLENILWMLVMRFLWLVCLMNVDVSCMVIIIGSVMMIIYSMLKLNWLLVCV